MAYTIPAGNALSVDFATADTGYAAPAGNALSVNFTEIARNDCLRFDQKWAVGGVLPDAVLLNQKWAVSGTTPDTVLLDQKWITQSYDTAELFFTQQWAVGGAVGDTIRFTQQWAVGGAVGDTIRCDQQWQVLSGPTDGFIFDQQWAVASAVSDTQRLNQSWDVEGTTADTHRLTGQWDVEGATPDTQRFGQQWIVTGQPTDTARLDQQWSVLAGSDTVVLNQKWGVAAPLLESCKFGQQWNVEGTPVDTVWLGQKWAIAGAAFDRQKLNQKWAVEEAVRDMVRTNQKWAVTAQENDTVLLDTIYAVAGAATERAWLDQQWSIPIAPVAERVWLDQQWSVTEVPVDTVRFDQQWDVEGLMNDILRFNQQWATQSYEQDTVRFNQAWFFRYYVDAGWVLEWGSGVARGWSISSTMLESVAQGWQLPSPINNTVARAWELDSNMGAVVQAWDLPSPINESVARSWDITYAIRKTVARAWELPYAIKNTNTAARGWQINYQIIDEAQIIVQTNPILTVNGEALKLADGTEVSMDEGQFAWTCQCALADPSFYGLFEANTPFTVLIGGELYSFIVDSKQLGRSSGVDINATVSGISPTAVLSDPRARLITKTWAVPTLVSALFEELLAPYGFAIDMQVTDWAIPAFRLAVENETPMAIMQKVMAATGGYIETTPAGTLLARYAYPASVPLWAGLAPQQQYNDDAHNFSVSENLASNKIQNRLRILDVAAGAFADTIEFTQSTVDPSKGVLKVWPKPWRDTFTVEHTSLPIVSIAEVGEQVSEVITETIEVLRGQAQTNKPINTVTAVEWLYANLGGVVFDRDSNILHSTATDKTESLLRITYTTRYYLYDIVAFNNAQVQVLVLEPEDA